MASLDLPQRLPLLTLAGRKRRKAPNRTMKLAAIRRNRRSRTPTEALVRIGALRRLDKPFRAEDGPDAGGAQGFGGESADEEMRVLPIREVGGS
jgi:hypothetical protein